MPFWNLWLRQPDLPTFFDTMCSLGLHFPDFEDYHERSQNPEQAGLDTYIRIRK
jgi:hypothetical protein